MKTETTFAPPSRLLHLLEWRAFGELASTLSAWPLTVAAPRGDGHAVLVLPGLAAGNGSTRLMRTFLRARNFDVHGWRQGRNFGPRAGVLEGMLAQLEEMARRSAGKVSLVGWSLGGVYAHRLARERPELVRSVVTLGSPIRGHARATNAWRLYEFVSGQHADRLMDDWFGPDPSSPLPITSIWSRTDGIVAWRNSVQLAGVHTENIEVFASHLGLGVNSSVFYALADRLAQPEGQWRPFTAPLLVRGFYPKVKVDSL